MRISTAIDAEVAYRQERVAQHFRPWRRVGAERVTARRMPPRARDTGRLPRAAASSVVTLSR